LLEILRAIVYFDGKRPITGRTTLDSRGDIAVIVFQPVL
jgi:hypothetical protein